ncbi:MAG: GGDEF domain-containing protein [Pseudodesulfovibrio sp.]|uniref:diguanylate cyclase n=1 Tax=Pseudodesulfovibrio aespoeensis (strain ATCC 700646 / DSM 10631 / Aspo-2) TaxID=643562 RepID=E6VSB0_PSEA9|nr:MULTISPECIES: GGDEF domain-containing protein [Pseudodesulfovibrio]MBU4191794.1 GGDEF domain-containing protein [Pseudomonadota bacterium]ADU64253.1 diguanylate cyclase [Pseudodesulfovibrio aespoeensis Aspo-2]MBU4243002.1 GGDEF domain-containing protein [Pseudomonadota bacterium]MBU4380303.1 GGDEF domain-containing protein [Pseudomonadota bacterium]MBU4475600.1 GGDEF domain-containing protein [Pseudomonadota bacterium]
MLKQTIKRGKRPELMWGLGLDDSLAGQIAQGVGPGFHIRNFPADSLPRARELSQEEKPCAAWVPWSVWSALSEQRRQEYRAQENTQRILIQDTGDEPLEMDTVLAEGFLTVVRTPLTRPKVQDAVFRAREVTSMYSDIYRMTEEILLERELLARKTDQLMFLNKILASATESLDPATILLNAKDTLSLVLPVKMVHAAFWTRQQDSGVADVELFLNGKMIPDTESLWVEHLMASAAEMGSGPVNGFNILHTDPARRPEFSLTPKDGKLVTMPLTAAHETFGCLVLLCEPDYRLGRDQVETFRSAVNHLGLALRNALIFKEVKLRADRDGLTRIYNRHSFDERLIYEIKRRRRYNHDLSLLMVDLDHFKQVNDTYGHKAGDMVLRKVGEILTETFRTTDLAARYGGEEFVVLLPHTSEEAAWKLAERIRESIQGCVFRFDGHEFSVTASIGVASVEAGALTRDDDLLIKADKALYKAKNNGRNMVVISRPEGAAQAVTN